LRRAVIAVHLVHFRVGRGAGPTRRTLEDGPVVSLISAGVYLET